jgi:hypothetical protein
MVSLSNHEVAALGACGTWFDKLTMRVESAASRWLEQIAAAAGARMGGRHETQLQHLGLPGLVL